MIFKNYKSSTNAHKLVFYDGLEINPNESPDEICKCFIKQSCVVAQDVNTQCSYGQSSDTKIDTGEFSVKSKRLPLKKIYLGDIDGQNKNVSFELKSLKCSFNHLRFILQEFPLDTIDCVTGEYNKFKNILIDGDDKSCIKYDSLFIQLKFVSIENIKKIEMVDNADSDITYEVTTKNDLKCIKENDVFNCPLPYTKLNIQIINNIKNFNYILCEIKIIQ